MLYLLLKPFYHHIYSVYRALVFNNIACKLAFLFNIKFGPTIIAKANLRLLSQVRNLKVLLFWHFWKKFLS